MKKIFVVLLSIACWCTTAEAKVITSVVRANGASGTNLPIGAFDGNTQCLPMEEGGVKDGNLMRSDRPNHVFAKTPTGTLGLKNKPLIGSEYVRTFNNDKDAGGANVTYAVTISRPATVWITMDDRWNATDRQNRVNSVTSGIAPAGTFIDTVLKVYVGGDSDRPMSIYAAELDPGTYVFGPNQGNNFYLIGAFDAQFETAQNPAPISGDSVVTTNVTVNWDPGSDPNNSITTHKLYTDAYNTDPADPNLYLVADIANTGARVSYELAALPDTKLISWRVDAVYDSGVITGVVWSFQKMLVDVTQEPVDIVLWPGDTAIFSTTVNSPETLLYQWFKYDPALPDDQQVPLVDGWGISGVNTPDLSIANVKTEDEGQYVCAIFTVATISNPTITRLANLTLYRRIAHWTFDDASLLDPADPADPNMYLDETGNYPATCVGEFVSEPGIVGGGQALRFNGGYLTIPNTGTDPGMRFDYTNMLTVSVWIKTADMQHPGSSNDWTGLVTKGDNSWQLSRQGNTVPQLIRFSSNGSLIGTTPVADNNWHLIVGTFDGTSSKLYIDGVLDVQGTFGTALGKNTADVWIGNTRVGSNNRLYNGLMDDVRIYNYALTREDIAQMYYDVTGQRACMYGRPAGDVNGDCALDLEDIMIMASEWLTSGLYSPLK
jgi:hypothetical protein